MTPANRPRVLVAGGGIGGLTAARALLLQGLHVTLVEQASAWQPVGAGISLAVNAVAALDRVGLGDAVRAAGRPIPEGVIGDRRGRPLQRVALEGLHVLAHHRAELHGILLEGADAADLRLGTQITDLHPQGSGVEVELSDGTTMDVELLVGADGVRSMLRRRCWPDGPSVRDADITVWRVTTVDPLDASPQIEQWGDGAVAGLVPLTGDRVYAYFAVRTAETGHDDAVPRTRFSRFGGPVRAFLDELPDTAPALRHELVDLDGVVFGDGPVALLGDAAHAMLPYLGQGAAQAIEDAAALADAVAAHRDVTAAVASYRERRTPRARAVQRRSRAAGAVAHLRPAGLVALRDATLRLVPRASSRALAALLRQE